MRKRHYRVITAAFIYSGLAALLNQFIPITPRMHTLIWLGGVTVCIMAYWNMKPFNNDEIK